MNEETILKLSVVLLCFLSLLLPLVLFLVVWLRRIQSRVDSISNEWSVLCKLAPSDEPLTPATETQHEIPNALSDSLVIFNQQAEGSDENNTWKHIPRGFVYSHVYDDGDGPRPDEEQSACQSQEDAREVDDESNSQEQVIPDTSTPVASYLQIVDENPAIVGVSLSERPATDAKQDRKIIFVSASSTDDLNLFADHDDCQVNENTVIEMGTENGNDIPQNSEATETGELECVVLIEDTKQTNEVLLELPNVTSPPAEEVQIGTSTQGGQEEDAERSDKKVLTKEGCRDASENYCKAPSTSLEDGVEVSPPMGEITEKRVASETRPKPKPRLSKKKHGRVNSAGKEKTFNSSPHVKNPNEAESHCNRPDQEADRWNVPVILDVCDSQQLAQQHIASSPKTAVKSKKNTNERNNVQVVKDVGHSESKSKVNDGEISNYESVVIVDSGNEGKKMPPSANTQEVTRNNESTGVISQLRGFLTNRASETQNPEKRAKPAVRHSYPAKKQGNINEDYRGKGKTAKRMSFPHNPEDLNRHERGVVKHDRTVLSVVQGKTGAASKSNQNCNKPGISEGDTSEYEMVVTPVDGGKKEPVTDNGDSSDIISQLRSILHKGNTASADNPDLRHENKSGVKNEEHKRHATAAGQNNENTPEQVYSNLDEEGNEIYSEIPSSASETKAGTTNNDQEEVHNLSEQEPFYVNLPFQQGLINYNDGPALKPDEHEPPIYINSDIIDI